MQRLALFKNKRHLRKAPYWNFRKYDYDWFKSLGIEPLVGTVRYPSPSMVLVKAHA